MKYFTRILPFWGAIVIAGFTILWISLLFPQEGRFRYEYSEGLVWSYPDLFAPFDFPVYKNWDQIEQEKLNVTQHHIPTYIYDRSVSNQVITSTISEFDNAVSQLSLDSVPHGAFSKASNQIRSFLEELYSQPISETKLNGTRPETIKIEQGDTILEEVTAADIPAISSILSIIDEWSPDIDVELLALAKTILRNNLKASLYYSKEKTDEELKHKLGKVTPETSTVKKGELIVPQGAIVSEHHLIVLNSLKEQYNQVMEEERSANWVFAGFLLLTILIIGVYILFLYNHQLTILKNPLQLSFLFMWFLVFSYLVYAVETYTDLSSYLLPFCIVPIVIKNFYNERLAFFTHVVVILIASFLSNLGYEFTFLQILTGILTVLTVQETREWGAFFRTIFLIFSTYVLGFLGLEWIKSGDFQLFDHSTLIWLGLNAFLTLLAYPLIPLIERIFGFTSAISLVELADMNKPLLRELSLKAPGTFQHSLQVGNIAEDAANEIGVNSLLIRTAALYHDIGKMNAPNYFIENQSGGSPHNDTNPLESAKIIINHVTEGVAMAKKAKLPKAIVSMIQTHHGTTRVEYFYRKYLELHPSDTNEESGDIVSSFSYPGPKPITKEESILMLADSLEASCKSLHEHNAESIDLLVERIIDYKINNGQFTESELSFEELEKCKMSFKRTLKSIYHVRIAYPGQSKS